MPNPTPRPTGIARQGQKFAVNRTLGFGCIDLGSIDSAKVAHDKSTALTCVCQSYFQNTKPYTGGPITDVQQAIMYAASKKLTKSKRQAGIAAVSTVAMTVGTVTGATLGSVVPGAGTALGGVFGHATASMAVPVGVHMARKAKWASKRLRKTAGVHRTEAATLLVDNANEYKTDIFSQAAFDAINILMNFTYKDEADDFRGLSYEKKIGAVAARMKSV